MSGWAFGFFWMTLFWFDAAFLSPNRPPWVRIIFGLATAASLALLLSVCFDLRDSR
jgi:hypothetical protein